MTARFFSRCHHGEPDAGVYAVLYAVLMVVLIAMGAVVVDFASVRQDRRLDRSATDSAVLGAGAFLDPQGAGGMQPKAACLRAWDYLSTTLRISTPASACSAFNGIVATTYCASASPAEIADNRIVGGRTVRISWPIPRTGGSGFLNPDLAPGAVQQTFSSDLDGSDKGCDRIGAAIFESPTFLLGGALGSRGTNIQVHSVARFSPDGGPADEVAALNVLNPLACQSLITEGGGQVLVGPTLNNDGSVAGPGILAVESAGNSGSGCNDGIKAVIAPNTSSGGSLICASNTPLDPLLPNQGCDGQGLIRSHAMDPGGLHPYNLAAVPANLMPKPVSENGTHGWNPVTHLYGCVTLNPCADGSSAPSGYIKALNAAFGGTGSPSPYLGGVYPYNNSAAALTFKPVPASVCAAIKTPLPPLPAGNWYANCQINVQNGGALIVQGGTLVVEGGISVASGGCFVMNVSTSACQTGPAHTTDSPPITHPTGSDATTNPPPASDAIVFLRGNGCPGGGGGSSICFSTAGKAVMPQTFVYSAKGQFNVNSSDVTLWTAPGAGTVSTTTTRTNLEDACSPDHTNPPSLTNQINADCMNSRFSRLAYWNETPASSTQPDNFVGQGSLSVVGVFFIPRAYFDIAGGGAYAAASAQFWADQIDVKGNALLGLLPDTRTSITSPTGAVTLIR